MTTNPLYLFLIFAAVLVVGLSFPPGDNLLGQAVGVFLAVGTLLLMFRLVFVTLLTENYGHTTLSTVPSLQLPAWLGGGAIGGEVTAEVLVVNAVEGFRLMILLGAFGVFNARADLTAMIRSVPSAFRDVGLVISIAIAFVPGMLRTISSVRDAQRLRGEWGLRRLAPSLAVPVLGLSMERALMLAESMDIRGYGRGQLPRSARTALWVGLVLPLAGITLWAGGWGLEGAVLACAGGVALLWSFRGASTALSTTRLQIRSVSAFDLATILTLPAIVAAVLAAAEAVVYDPSVVLHPPTFDWMIGSISFLLVVPAFAGGETRAAASRR